MIRKAWAKDAKALKYLYEEVLHPSHSKQEWDQGNWGEKAGSFLSGFTLSYPGCRRGRLRGSYCNLGDR